VGAGADLGEKGFLLARFSSRGPTADGRIKPDLWAPGVRIMSARGGSGYELVSGTSFATPFVAGVAALMLEANPGLGPSRIKSILMKSSQKWSPTKSNETGKGRLQAYDAIIRAASITQNLNPPDVPELLVVKAPIAPNEIKVHPFQVTGTTNNIALTVILTPPVAGGLKIELLNSTGVVVAQTTEFSRHGSLSIKPGSTGVYNVRLQSQGGSATYVLDVSAD
jgi:serine protease AprX